MVKLNQLPSITSKPKKRIGRGYGSGVGGHTTIRGMKGLKARNKVKLTFDGTKIKKSWLKRLPFWPGKRRHKPLTHREKVIINLDQLEANFKKGQLVDLKSLIAKGLLPKGLRRDQVKLLGRGKMSQSLKINLICSKIAREKVLKAGGEVLKESLEKAKETQKGSKKTKVKAKKKTKKASQAKTNSKGKTKK